MSDEEDAGCTLSLGEFDQNLEILTEKRTQAREEALEALCKALKSQFFPQAVGGGRWHLIASASKLVKSSSTREAVAASSLIGLAALTLGESQQFYDAVHMALRDVALATEDDLASVGAIHALGATCFFCSSEGEDTVKCMETCFECFEEALDERPLVAAAAVAEWARLLTTAAETAQDSFDTAIRSFTDALMHGNVEVRVQAGRAIALLFELLRGDEDEDHEGPPDMTQYEDRCDVSRLMELVRGLSGTAGSKHDRARQQAEFKAIAKTLQDGVSPSESVTVRFQERKFTGWSDRVQLDGVRLSLATGFHKHLESNEVLHAVFSLEIDSSAVKRRLTQTEKRLTMSPSSAKAKEQTKKLRQSRDARATRLRGELIDGDGDSW